MGLGYVPFAEPNVGGLWWWWGGGQGTGCGMWCLVRPDSLSHSCVRSGRPKPQALSVGGSGCSKKMGLLLREWVHESRQIVQVSSRGTVVRLVLVM